MYIFRYQLKQDHHERTDTRIQIAIEGCLHGELQQVYHQLGQLQQKTGIEIDALIICGDFQAIRDQQDLEYMHCPEKFRKLGSFQKYYSGEVETPYLTIFIGGNHEAVNYMRDLYYGGWVAPKIYYLGQAGSIYLKKGDSRVRITGLSGIYNDQDFKYSLGTERIPLRGKSKVSSYHVKQIEIFRLELLGRIQMMKKQNPKQYGNDGSNFDIFLSHDWPKDIAKYGNRQKLYQMKPFLKQQIQNGTLGSLPSERLMKIMKPNYWFSAHMHVKFAALLPHAENERTHFLSLDKCLKYRSCLQLLNFGSVCENKNKVVIQLDEVWLNVLKLTYQLQFEKRSLYKFGENKTLQIFDIELMNGFIEKYQKTKINYIQKCQLFQQNRVIEWKEEQQKGQQLQQTKYLISHLLQLDIQKLSGIIFQKGHQTQDKEHQVNKIHIDQLNISLF